MKYLLLVVLSIFCISTISAVNSFSYEIDCNYSRDYYSLINPFSVILYDSKCGKKPNKPHKPKPHKPKPQKPNKPNVKPYKKPITDYEYQQYQRELKRWSDDMAYKIMVDLVGRYQRGEFINYLDNEQMNDILYNGYMFQEPLEECISYWVRNDVDNIGNMINTGYDVAGYMAGTVRSCYMKVRGF